MILTPDFTMEEECCKQENDARVVFKEGQVISFATPIYGETLDITILGTVTRSFVRGVDWVVAEEDLDTDTLSRLKLQEPTFDEEVIKSIHVTRSILEGTQLTVAMTYQQVYPIRSQKILLNNQPIVWTADLAKEMIEDLSYLKALTAPTQSIFGVPRATSPRLLEEDPYKENVDNMVSDEIHAINVPNNKMYVHPIAGAFFKDSLKVEYVYSTDEPNKVLVEGEDYLVCGCDRAKTAATTNIEGVYDFIYFLKPYVGDVSISYWAYGGIPTLYDQQTMEESINNIINHLNEINAVTPSTLNAVPAFRALSHEVFHLREDMRRLTQDGRATYGDVTSGMTLKKKLVATDSDTHWWTIATLYKVDTQSGSSEVMTAEEFIFKYASLNTNMMFTCAVDVNLNREDRVLEVSLINDCSPKGFTPFESYDHIEMIPRPQLRVIYNTNDQMNSGVALQIGLKLSGVYEDYIAIEDLSGKESAWKLVEDDTTATTGNYQDDLVVLPNDAHVWDKLNPESKMESTLVPLKRGHLVWAGSRAVNRPSTGILTLDLKDHFLDDDIDISTIKKARVELEETGGTRFALEMPFVDGTETKTGTSAFAYNGATAYMNVHIKRDAETSKLVITVEAYSAAGLSANKLDMKHLYLFT